MGAGQAAPAARRASNKTGRPESEPPSQVAPPPPPPVINGMLRGQVILKCNLSPLERAAVGQSEQDDHDDNDEVSLILWYKDNSMVPIFSVDARATPVLEARHKPGAWLEGRSSLEIKEEDDEADLRRKRAATTLVGPPESPPWAWLPTGEDESPSASATSESTLLRRRPRRRARRRHLVANLAIDSLSSEDNGFYKCRVDFKRSRSRLQEQEVRIIVPAERPLIRDLTAAATPPRVAHNSLAGPHNENERLVLECETSGGYPEPTLTWWREGKLVDDSYELVSALDGSVLERRGAATTAEELDERGPRRHFATSLNANQDDQQTAATTTTTSSPQNRLMRNRLELGPLSRHDLLANYSCQARNSQLGEPPTSFVMIDMNLRPLRVQIDNERAPVLAARPLEVVCRAFGARPAASVSWFLNKSRLVGTGGGGGGSALAVQVSESADANLTATSVLSFVPQIEHSGQVLTCRAENAYLSAAAAATSQQLGGSNPQDALDLLQSPPAYLAEPNHLEDSWKLEVHYAPRVQLALGQPIAQRAAVQVGHDVYFECTARAQPPARELRWWFNGKELEQNTSSGVIISNQSLVLQRVSRHQRGRYTCSALNSVGESHSNPLYLRIQHEPFCRGDSSSTSSSGMSEAGPGRTGSATRHRSGREPSEPSSTDDTAQGETSNQQQQQHKTHYGAARLESVAVRCQVEADPSDSISYKWAFVARGGGGADSTTSQRRTSTPAETNQQNRPEWSGQQVVYLNASQFGSPPGRPLESVLDYTPRTELDYGTLLCWASNSLGQQVHPCAYQVVPAERPEPLRSCRVLNATDAQLAVACEPGYDGGINQSFHMEVYESRNRDQLVANVSDIPGLSSSIFNEAVSAGHAAQPASSDDNDEPEVSSNTIDSTIDSPETNQRDEAPKRSEPQNQQLAASLVSESPQAVGGNSTSGRLQKQRHSYSKPSAARPAADDQPEVGRKREAVFLTEPQLAPSTDYFISVYASNSKGSSKPVGFTASTSNRSGGAMGATLASLALGQREGRRSMSSSGGGDHSSALISEVFALTWSPFLVVCTVTILFFVLFASLTFALIKYVDLNSFAGLSHTGGLSMGNHRRPPPPGSSPSAAKAHLANQHHLGSSSYATSVVSSAGSGSTASGPQQQQPHQNRAAGQNQLTGNHLLEDLKRAEQGSTLSRRRTEDEYSFDLLQGNPQQHFHRQQEACLESTGAGRPRARVLAVGATPPHWPLTTPLGERDLEIPLNGASLASNQKRASLLNGSYLKAKLAQLAGANGQQQFVLAQAGSALKLSNSDNHLNQALPALERTTTATMQAQQQQQQQQLEGENSNWFQFRAPHYQAAYWAAGGTLPRPLNASAGAEQPGRGAGASCHLELDAAPAYGYLKLINNNKSGQTALASNQPAAGQQLEQFDAAGHSPNCSLAPGGAPPLEHLLISGKQYVHQVAPISDHQFQQQQQQHHHHDHHYEHRQNLLAHQQRQQLQMTSSPGQQQQIGLLTSNGGACCGPTPSPLANQTASGPSDCCNQSGGELMRLRQATTTPRTSDLGEDDDDDDDDDGQEGADNVFEDEDCPMGRLAALQPNHQLSHLQHHSASSQFAAGASALDSDGMSSQGTQKSSLHTPSLLTSATANGSPSSGYGPEAGAHESAAAYQISLQQQQQQQQPFTCSSASTTASTATANTCGPDPGQQMVQCSALRPATKSAGLRQTMTKQQSITFDASGLPAPPLEFYAQQQADFSHPGSPSAAVANDENNNNNNNNNKLLGSANGELPADQQAGECQFYLLPNSNFVLELGAHNQQQQLVGSLLRSATRTRTRNSHVNTDQTNQNNNNNNNINNQGQMQQAGPAEQACCKSQADLQTDV